MPVIKKGAFTLFVSAADIDPKDGILAISSIPDEPGLVDAFVIGQKGCTGDHIKAYPRKNIDYLANTRKLPVGMILKS